MKLASSYEELLADRGVDAVVLATPHSLHSQQVIAASAAGKHVFCQARMARDAAEARAMLAAAEAHPGQVAMLCPPPQGMKGDRLIRNLLAEGYLGELREVHASGLSAGYADPSGPLHWRQNWELQGYNTLTLGMWVEVIHRWVGPHRSVSAVIKTLRHPCKNTKMTRITRPIASASVRTTSWIEARTASVVSVAG